MEQETEAVSSWWWLLVAFVAGVFLCAMLTRWLLCEGVRLPW